jgi:predicted ATPase
MEDRFEGGIAFVGLNDARTEEEALSCIAHALDLRLDGRQKPSATLRRYLADRELLLVLDGFEGVRIAGPEIVRLLQAAPRLKVLVTSRAPLKVSGEREFPVPPLSLPVRLTAAVEFPLNSEAVALFVDRAVRARPDFRLTAGNIDAVAEICRRLDGLPLAIELAAARVKSLTPEAIAERLEARFALLRHGPSDLPLRHRSLETAIGWSCELLDESERRLFRRLGVFAGGFGLELAEPIFEADGISALQLIDGLATLVDYSLVSQLEIAGKPRFEMLDTVHAYGRKLLAESGEEEEWRGLHANQVAAWAEDGERFYCTPEQGAWFQRVEGDHENIQAAIQWALDREEASLGVRLGAALWPFWVGAGHLIRARAWLERILAMKGRAPRSARAKALLGASWVASAIARHEEALEHAKRSAALSRAAGDRSGQIRALETLGFVALQAGQTQRAESAFESCLARSRALGDSRRQAIALDALGQVALARGDDLGAESHFREGVSIARRIGHTTAVAQGLVCLGDVALRAGAHERALGFHEEALAIYREAGQKINIAWTLSCLGSALVGSGRLGAARDSYAEALPIFHELGYVRGMAFALNGFAAIALSRGDAESAARILGGTETLVERANDRLSPFDEAAVALQSAMEDRLPRPRSSPQWSEGRKLDADRLVALALTGEAAIARRASG